MSWLTPDLIDILLSILKAINSSGNVIQPCVVIFSRHSVADSG